MLRVRPIHHGASGAVVKYLTEYLTEAIGEPAGRWVGRQAPALGLPVEVDAADLQAMLDGIHPLNGITLGAPFTTRQRSNGKKVSSVIGFDATFSAPKTLSIMWALSGDDGFAECHDIAVQAAIVAVERRAATTRVRSNGTRMFLDTEGITAAVFRQSTSRADDPQLHSHVLISSKVQTPDGRWRALGLRRSRSAEKDTCRAVSVCAFPWSYRCHRHARPTYRAVCGLLVGRWPSIPSRTSSG